MKLLAILLVLVFSSVAFGQPPQAPPVRLDIVEARILAVEAQTAALAVKVDNLTAAVNALDHDVHVLASRLQPALAAAPAGTRVNVGNLWYTARGDGTYQACAECNAGVAAPVGSGAAGVCPAGTCDPTASVGYVMPYTAVYGSSPTYAGAVGSCGSGNSGSRRTGPVRGFVRGLFSGCGG